MQKHHHLPDEQRDLLTIKTAIQILNSPQKLNIIDKIEEIKMETIINEINSSSSFSSITDKSMKNQ